MFTARNRMSAVLGFIVVQMALAGLALSPPIVAQGLAQSSAPPQRGSALRTWPEDPPLVPEPVRQAMQDRDYAGAVKAIDAALAGRQGPEDYLLWLKGRALHLGAKYDEAIGVFESLEKRFPTSAWVRRARFGRAMALARKGDFRAAELIYRAEAEYLLSPERRQQIVAVYLEFADAYFQPPQDDQKPDYAKALEFYRKALEMGPRPERLAEVQLQVARCVQRLGRFDEAIGLYEKFISEHPDHRLDVEARYSLGECRLAKGDRAGARRTWQDLLAKYAESREDRLAEAAYRLAQTWGVPPRVEQPSPAAPSAATEAPAPAPALPGGPSAGGAPPVPPEPQAFSLGIAALEAFIEKFPEHKLASRATLDMALTYMHLGRHGDAARILEGFLANPRYQDREEIPEARYLLGRALRQQKKFSEALKVWQEYLVRHPTHSAWSAVQREIVETEFAMARDRFEAKDYAQAAKLWTDFQSRYPLDPRLPEILYWLGEIEYRQERWEPAIAAWRRLVAKYPNNDWSSRAQWQLARTLEEKLARLEQALEEYRKLTWGPWQPHARQAMARLTATELVVVTERVFRSDETPHLALTTRNVEKVSVRAYRVDLETYFRKMHLARGVESLDVALISPDRAIELAIPGYAKHRQIESRLELPLPGGATAGAMVVTVASPTLEATGLVLQSDLEIIVKSSRNEIFVFAENLRTGTAWPGVKLLVSDGRQIFAEGVTGPDGVFRGEFKELAAAQDVRVFATAGDHVASNVVDLQGVGVAQALADKGYLYTDRPAYRPGQVVHFRGCLRHAVADAFTIQRGKAWTLDLFDSRNRLIGQRKVTLNDFGTFYTHLALPLNTPQGQYRFVVRDEANRSFTGTFLVQPFVLEPIRLVVDTPRRVYYRGEDIEGTIRAEFYYGTPIAGREIRYQLAGQPVQTAVTDSRGQVRFKLPTREFQETQVLPLVVSLPERNLRTAVHFVLACQGFTLELTTPRPVYLAGETFEVTVKARDAEGKPLAQKLVLSVLERTTVQGEVGQRLVEQQELQTATADGVARATLKLAKGGRYVLRAEGTDRFHNPVSAEQLLLISDDEDDQRLRILADRHTYKVGETGQVDIVWRQTPALALVTFQGAQVLDYQLVHLRTGTNRLALPMTAKLAPNFELAIAVMHDAERAAAARPGPAKPPEAKPAEAKSAAKPKAVQPAGGKVPGDEAEASQAAVSPLPGAKPALKPAPPGPSKPVRRFHIASSPFSVERDLRVGVAVQRKVGAAGPLQPGETVQVTVTTTDPEGRPVSAEVSLAMIEQSLLERFAWPVPPIHEFFRGNPRQPAVRTTSSITFSYRPATRPIPPQLLAEADRRELAHQEEESRRLLGAEAAGGMVASIEATPKETAGLGGMPGHPGAAPGAVPEAPPSNLGARRALREARTGAPLSMPGAPPVSGALADGAANAEARGFADMRLEANAAELQDALRLKAPLARKREAGVALGQGAGADEKLGFGMAAGKPAELKAGAGELPLEARWGADKARQAPAFPSALVPVSPQTVWESLSAPAAGSTLVILDSQGRMQHWKPGPGPAPASLRHAQAVAAELNRLGAVLVAGAEGQETGYWNPAVVTDAKGQATLEIVVPERTTAWRIVAKGITGQTLAGETSTDLVVKKTLFGELKLPLAFTEGDEAQVLAVVHNDALEKGSIELTLRTSIGGRTVEEKKSISAKSKGLYEETFRVALQAPGGPQALASGSAGAPREVTFELSVSAGELRDRLRRTVPLVAYGAGAVAAASGTSTGDATVWIDLPAEVPPAQASLQITIGPTIQRSLLDILLGPPSTGLWATYRVSASLDSATSDLMAGVAIEKLLAGARDAGGPQARTVAERIAAAISLLVSAQQDDGGWSWTGQKGKSNRYVSARAVWALGLARTAGYPVPDDAFQKALAFLKNQIAATDNSDYETKAILLHALTVAGHEDFALANRLYRDRPQLSTAALLYLALTFAAMDRKPTATELLALVAQRNLDDSTLRRRTPQGLLPWSHAPAELHALYALALQAATPQDPRAREQVDWLLAHRTGSRWTPDKATGPAALALCTWFAATRFEGQRYRLAVFVNDVQAGVLDFEDASATAVLEVPSNLLKPGRQRVNFQMTGRGRYAYQCLLSYFVPADKLKPTSPGWIVQRYWEPGPLEFDGREVPRGFAILRGSFTSFRNPLTQLPVGRRAQVELVILRPGAAWDVPEDQLEYLVLVEPIPAGTTVVESSIRGWFDGFEIGPGAITFYIGNRRGGGSITYELAGYLPGRYRAGPSVLRDAYRPDQFAIAPPQQLAVLPQETPSADPYRLTPQELYELGKRHFDKSQWKEAQRHFAELLEKWNPRPDIYKEVVLKLLDIHLQLGPPAAIVRYFEIVKEKWPSEEIPFEKIARIGAAYHELGEYERSYLVFRATVEGRFMRETHVAGFLDAQGEFLRSVDVMGRLLREYPAEPYIAAATFALAQRVYAKAPQAAEDPKLRQQKVNRVDLIRRAWAMLEGFLTAWPDDPAADQAAFAAANALLETRASAEAARAAQRYAQRYPQSELLDSFWYILGYCYFASGRPKEALEMCRRVAEATRVDRRTGAKVESPNKYRAIYILGQVHHSLGQAAEAVAQYRRVEDRFADAKEAIQYFLRRAIALPEVTTVRPGEPAQVQLEFRNTPACDVKVYAIDLMKYSLLKRSLGAITQINLAGIRPHYETTIKLGDGRDYRTRTTSIALPLKEEGAYLVVCRADDLYATGLVLVTPLAIEVQEDAASGRVRVTIKDTSADRYLPGVHVKVIGSRNSEFVSGPTDLRGVFVADGIRGTTTAIAQIEPSRYAFFRGRTDLVPEPPAPPRPGPPQAARPPAPGTPGAPAPAALEKQLLEGLQETNTVIQGRQIQQLQQIYQRQQKGVEAQQAY